jgi:hypothetical protein
MKAEIDVKWFHFNQNNSGGKFVVNENVCEDVLIQAANAEQAIAKAHRIMDNSDSCPCCGDRWSFWVDDSDGTEEPEIYGEKLSEKKRSLFRDEARLHHFDGRVETFVYPKDAS